MKDDEWRLSDEQGTLVLLILWGTFDGPSRVQIPLLRDLFQRYDKEESLKIIGGFLDYRIYIAKNYLNHNSEPWAHQQIYIGGEDNVVTRNYGIESLPSNWLLDANGVILEANIPSDELEAVIEKHLK